MKKSDERKLLDLIKLHDGDEIDKSRPIHDLLTFQLYPHRLKSVLVADDAPVNVPGSSSKSY